MIKCDDFVEDDEVEDVRDVSEGRVDEIDDLSRVFYSSNLIKKHKIQKITLPKDRKTSCYVENNNK